MENHVKILAQDTAFFIQLWLKTNTKKEDIPKGLRTIIEDTILMSKAWYLPEDKMPKAGSEIVYEHKNTKSIGVVYAENNQAVIVINKMLQLTLPVANVQKWRYL